MFDLYFLLSDWLFSDVVFVTLYIESLVHVDLVCERVSERQSGEKHLDADDEVLVTGGNSPLPHSDIRRVDARNGAALLQNRQQHPYVTQDNIYSLKKTFIFHFVFLLEI